MLFHINGTILGGFDKPWLDRQPRHRIAFDPGEVWLGAPRLISHQIYHGEAALLYMWFMRAGSMADTDRRFNVQVERVHAEIRARGAASTSAPISSTLSVR